MNRSLLFALCWVTLLCRGCAPHPLDGRFVPPASPDTGCPCRSLTAADIYRLRPLGFHYPAIIVSVPHPLFDACGNIVLPSVGRLGGCPPVQMPPTRGEVGSEISLYDALFRRYAPWVGWDWRLLAALVYHESRFNPLVESGKGAVGLMQLMPVTARQVGLDSADATDPEANIAAGVRYIAYLQSRYNELPYSAERLKFVLAAYNAGPGHIGDAMRLAAKYGRNPHVWYDNVEYGLVLKDDPAYYQDSVVRHGRFNGSATRAYVDNVLATWLTYGNP